MAAFFTNGALAASLMARYAEVKNALELSPAVFGFIVVSFVLGGVLAGQLPAIALRALGSRVVSCLGTVALTIFLVLATIGVGTGQLWLLVPALLAAGACDAVVDVAQNSQGLRAQQALGRSIINLMHAGWSAGAALGGLVGTLAASRGVPLPIHIAIWGGLCIIAIIIATRAYLPDTIEPLTGTENHSDANPTSDEKASDQPSPTPSLVSKRTVFLLTAPLVLVALSGITVEDLANNWSAVFLAQERGVPLGQAGIGLTTIITAQFIGRLVGDRIVDALGTRLALQTGLAAVIVGILVATWVPSMAVTMAGFALAGFGSAVTVPVAFTEADRLPGLRAQTGVTLVSWAMRVATVVLSPLVGAITTGTSIQLAFTVVAAIAIAGLIASTRVGTRS